ncbi:RnfABCDGE type electron transport complex subunit B [bacterium]|nr:RnfABCDGE type electron transport complex subunit B [bacterium]
MSNSVIVFSITVLGSLGLIFGLCLALASHFFYVKMDKRIENIYNALPNFNCGACGYPGCKKYAENIVKNNASINLCTPGGVETAQKIALVMGIEHNGENKRQVAYVFCCGGNDAKILSDYQGIKDCNCAVLVSGGPLQCDYGCMRFYSCVKVCKFDAIRINNKGLPEIIPEKCTGCMACVKQCPKDIIKMIPADARVFINCSSKDRGKQVMDACSTGCIGCTKCVKACPVQAIQMDEGLAVIDQEKCVKCLKCIDVCPVKVITTTKQQKG